MGIERPIYPFTAIVGQEKMKKDLLLNAVNPKLGGVLIRGEKGTAKSTAVRSLAQLLPEIEVVSDCPFSCPPDNKADMCSICLDRFERGEKLPAVKRRARVIDLPVSATEDRVVGTLNLEEAIKKGEKKFEPGILAEANRGILYVDEVNLLDDHIVDVLLDSAAMGVNTIEREGVSYSHPARFILVGTMNPEEGELRPQLLDRFGLCVNIEGILEPEARVEVIKRRVLYEDDPVSFTRAWEPKQQALRDQIKKAKEILDQVKVSEELLFLIARIAIEMNVDGHRADIIMMKAAKTLAALDGRSEVNSSDIQQAADLSLQHRMRRKPFQKIGLEDEKLSQIFLSSKMEAN
ncbi:MAG: ATP-binding protein [bacterium]|nr:ATP-binding protein [bacterium]